MAGSGAGVLSPGAALSRRSRSGAPPSAVTASATSVGGDRPRHDCLFPPLAPSPSAASRQPPAAGEGMGATKEGGAYSQVSRSEPSLPRPPASVLSAVSTSFVPLAPHATSSVAASQPPLLDWAAKESSVHPSPPAPASKVSAASPVMPRRVRNSGAAAAMLPYAASEVSSVASGWRQHYWQEPSVNFARGLLSQDVRYSTESSHCKCVIQEAGFPPLPKLSPAEVHNQHRIKWLSNMIQQEQETVKRPPRAMSEVNANVLTDKQLEHHPWSHTWLPAKATNAARKEAMSKSAKRPAD